MIFTIVPIRLLYYGVDHDFPINTFHIDQDWPAGSYYPIGLGFFNFTVDYFGIMSKRVRNLVRDKQLKVLFVYQLINFFISMRKKITFKIFFLELLKNWN